MKIPALVLEWLEEKRGMYAKLADESRGRDDYWTGFMRGNSLAFRKVLDHLESLDSSHDLPSTKG